MKNGLLIGALMCSVLSSQVFAKVSPQQAARLGMDLTPMGAEKAGNRSGSIPAWKGGITEIPLDYMEGDFHPDPYTGEKARFKITSKNFEKFKKYLTLGQIEMLKRHPSYFFNIYPSHRSASYPQFVYDEIKNNALTAELQQYGTGVKGTIMSSPFPIPETGAEALWNHTLRYRSLRMGNTSSTLNTTSSGEKSLTTREYKYYFSYSEPGITLDEIDNKIFYLKRKTLSPAKLAGQMTLVHETLDQVDSPRKSWIYMPGQRRVRRTPDLSYDTADIDSNGIRTIDQVDMFNGAPNLYNWELKGKTEKYIPYNSYQLHSGDLTVDEIAGSYHVDPALARYEPHRVWVVEATLRTGMSHIYHKRRYYFDEDSWNIVLAEEYNEDGKLVQYTEAHTINYYEVPMIYTTLEVTYDLEAGRYFAEGLDNERSPMNMSVDFKRREFTSSALRREAR
jgi:hypothetical protein